MQPHASFDLHMRSYSGEHAEERHDFAQLVLPYSGGLTLDVDGREGRITPGRAAFVGLDVRHSQAADRANRSLVLDLDPALVDPALRERLTRQPFVALPLPAVRLVEFMGLSVRDGAADARRTRLWAPLLLDALAPEDDRPRSRLAALLAAVEADPGASWTTAEMAARASVGVSRLHQLFRDEMDATPRGWLSEVRLRRACAWLGHSTWSIAEVAYRAGYSDQSALTRAMRKALGETPAAYRRRLETRPKAS